MPHLTTDLKVNVGPVVAPIIGNTNNGGACHDGGRQALYAVNVDGAIEVWRTRTGWTSLLRQDGSVDYLTTITPGPFYGFPSTVALQRIDGTIYAVVSGKHQTTFKAGQWIYRDTSTAKNGTGPWSLHGTVEEITYSPGNPDHFSGGQVGGEILIDGSRWAVNLAHFNDFGAGVTITTYGVATSDNGGITWTSRLNAGSMYGNRWSRNFGKYAGAWYVGGQDGNAESSLYRSTDLATWTFIRDTGIPQGVQYPFSTPDAIYRHLAFGGALEFATAPPDPEPAWSTVASVTLPPGLSTDDDPFPLFAAVGPPRRPVYVATRGGRLMRVSVGAAVAPPCQLYPRNDGLGMSSARQIYPESVSQQASNRKIATYY